MNFFLGGDKLGETELREVSRFMVRTLKEENFFREPLKTLLGVKRKIA